MNKTILIIMLAFLGLSTANAQVGIGTITPDASAALDVVSTAKGFLPPRMDKGARDAINGGSPAEGLTVFNTTSGYLEFYNGTKWIPLCKVSSDPIAGVPIQNIQTNQTEPGAINDGVFLADQGTAMNDTAHYIVMDLGQIYEANSVIRLDIWGNSTETRTVVTSEIPSDAYVAAGGANPQTNDVSVNGLDFYEYTLQNPTRYIQVDMTVRNGGRTEWIEVTITRSCF